MSFADVPGNNWLDTFSVPMLARQFYGDGTHFPLVDLSRIPDTEIMTHRSMAMLTLV